MYEDPACEPFTCLQQVISSLFGTLRLGIFSVKGMFSYTILFYFFFFFIKEMGKMESKLKLVLVSHTAGALRLSGISY